jgi:hypothetical protein
MSLVDCVRRTCPTCGAGSVKALYMGLPLRLCEDGRCETGWGLGHALLTLIPIETDEGEFMFWVYEGAYPIALGSWLFGCTAEASGDPDEHRLPR